MRCVERILAASLVVVLQAASLWAQGIPISDIQYPPFNAANCVQKPQRILVLDMKSGWWMGDGGELHHQILRRLVKDCPAIDVEYYYLQFLDGVTPPPIPIPGYESGVVGFLSFYPERPGHSNDNFMIKTAFPSRPWTDYNQIWLLSGGDHDPTDVPTTDEFFAKILTGLTQPAPPGQAVPGLWIGAGLSHHDHANKLLSQLAMPELIQSHTDELLVPGAALDNIEVLSRARRAGELQAHALFEGVETIADRMRVAGQDTEVDFMLGANNPFTIIGQNTRGEPAIAVRETEARRFVIDTGLSRFYSLFLPTEENTYRYLHNIIKYLAR